jgi:hypothetical protein
MLEAALPRLERKRDVPAPGLAPVAICAPERFPPGILVTCRYLPTERTLIDETR